jgi:folylpolyglutamate synthase/dihydropteroate synthase
MGSSLIKIEQMENYNMINSKIVGAVLEIVCRN